MLFGPSYRASPRLHFFVIRRDAICSVAIRGIADIGPRSPGSMTLGNMRANGVRALAQFAANKKGRVGKRGPYAPVFGAWEARSWCLRLAGAEFGKAGRAR